MQILDTTLGDNVITFNVDRYRISWALRQGGVNHILERKQVVVLDGQIETI